MSSPSSPPGVREYLEAKHSRVGVEQALQEEANRISYLQVCVAELVVF